MKPPLNEPLQIIYYGAPGTGKSFTIDDKTDDENSVRTTFHPDSDYASFVGAYKPTMEYDDIHYVNSDGVVRYTNPDKNREGRVHPGTEKKIVYKYVPQAFLKAYVAAWSNLDTPYFLIIEEINRGNCAQIFGDLFQLLDRNNAGSSSYAIHADEDITQFLSGDNKGFASLSDEQKDAIRAFELHKDNGKTQAVGQNILDGKLLLLPPNLYIWATMNTSDQSLFPIDSAFKRRWNWK
ncbi:AAA family ATPase, partial [uncultured Duncaniella sp.]|uniref:AAA family ATPase n=1 Tax=uncultured Duncaniella sp. TaxID=2768039 RepID=UPI0025A64908